MESLLDLIALACQFLDVDLNLDLFWQWKQSFAVGLACLFTLAHVYASGFDSVALLDNLCLHYLVRLPFQLYKALAHAFCIRSCSLKILTIGKQSFASGSLAFRMTC
jgi:hypothetical protein